MRLQLSIQRHALPTIQILFSTGTGPQSHTSSNKATIADLLHDVNELVPLESVDGEWGLEDYVVELAATADQELQYECLHFQPLVSVMREDDEIVIRPLTTEELRSRRIGGRIQISGDGRHLVDGVAFGRRWLKSGKRPGVKIPPRKRRRIDQGELRSLPEGGGSEMVLYEGEEDESEDESYTPEGHQPESQDGSDSNSSSDGSIEDEEVFDADELRQSPSELELMVKNVDVRGAIDGIDRHGKRKRRQSSEQDDGTFEGFSTPTQHKKIQHIAPEHELNEQTESLEQARQEALDRLEDSEPSSPRSPRLQDLYDPLAIKFWPETMKKATETVDVDDDESESYRESSSSGSSEGDFSEDEVGASDELISTDETSEDDPARPEQDATKVSATKLVDSSNPTTILATTLMVNVEPTNPNPEPAIKPTKPDVAPGDGQHKTHVRNQRNKKKAQLQRLQRQGILPSTATFSDLYQYEQERAGEVGAVGTNADTGMDETTTAVDQEVGVEDRPNERLVDAAPHDPTGISETQTNMSTPGSDQKRARLDVAATRRMLFGSLGMKNPKTPELERQLRQKISESFSKSPTTPVVTAAPPQEGDMDSWRDRIVLSAVECESDDVTLPPPPFPFVQGWSKGKGKSTPVNKSMVPRVVAITKSTTVQNVNSEGEVNTESSEGGTQFDLLPSLQQSDLHPSTVIAFKELEMSEATGYQPQISDYKIAHVREVSGDAIRLEISKREKQPRFDAETGERLYGKFELQDQDDVEDDGLKEVQFGDLMEPKLVQAADHAVGIPEVDAVDDIVIPESVPQDGLGHEGVEGIPAVVNDKLLTALAPDGSIVLGRSVPKPNDELMLEQVDQTLQPVVETRDAELSQRLQHELEDQIPMLDEIESETIVCQVLDQNNTNAKGKNTAIPSTNPSEENSLQDAQRAAPVHLSLSTDAVLKDDSFDNIGTVMQDASDDTQYSFVSFPSQSREASEDRQGSEVVDGEEKGYSTADGERTAKRRLNLRTSRRTRNRIAEGSMTDRSASPSSITNVSTRGQKKALLRVDATGSDADTIEVEMPPDKGNGSPRNSSRKPTPEFSGRKAKAGSTSNGGLGMKRFLTKRKV